MGAETRERYAHEGQSLLAIFEFLSKIDKPPPGTLQAVIDRVGGGQSKGLDGARRVPNLVVTTDLIAITALLHDKALAPILKDEHVEALQTTDGARVLAEQLRSMLVTLESNSQYKAKGGRTEEAAARAQAAGSWNAAPAPAQAAKSAERADALKELVSHPDFLSCRREHSERTWAAEDALVRAPDGPFASPTKTGGTARAAIEVLQEVRSEMRTVHAYQDAAEPLPGQLSADALRVMQLTKRFPKVAADVMARHRQNLRTRNQFAN